MTHRTNNNGSHASVTPDTVRELTTTLTRTEKPLYGILAVVLIAAVKRGARITVIPTPMNVPMFVRAMAMAPKTERYQLVWPGLSGPSLRFVEAMRQLSRHR